MKLRTLSALPAFCLSWWIPLQAQQAPVAPQTPTVPAVSGVEHPPGQGESRKTATKPIPSFLIIGTVFNEKALSFPGVQVRIRRSGERKSSWETYSDSRGEFAVRVPPGYEYEVLVHVKKYKDQTKSVDSKVDVQQRLSIQLELVTQKTNGAKS
jgi:hypothetical protein